METTYYTKRRRGKGLILHQNKHFPSFRFRLMILLKCSVLFVLCTCISQGTLIMCELVQGSPMQISQCRVFSQGFAAATVEWCAN